MNKLDNKELNRLHQILLFDSFGIPNSVIELLKTDIVNFLNNHFSIVGNSLTFDIELQADDKYKVDIKFLANDIYQSKIIK